MLPLPAYEQFFEHLPRCAFVVDEGERLVSLNRAARDYFAAVHRVDLVLGEILSPQLPTRLAGRWKKRFRETLQCGAVKRREVQVNEQGTAFLEAHYHRFGGETGTWIAALWHDVTDECRQADERAEMERELLAAKETRETLLSLLGHDLRAPISQLNALLYLLRNSPGQIVPERLERYLESLESTNHYLTQTLENILLWANLQGSLLTPQPIQFSAHDALSEAVGLHRASAESKELDLVVPLDAGITLHCDRQMLTTLFRNLLANAVKFTPSGGRIVLRHDWVEDRVYRFVVEDTGIGMDRQTRELALSEATLQSRPGTLGERGLGLGLSICVDFIRKLGGTLAITSAVNKGTRITVTVPMV